MWQFCDRLECSKDGVEIVEVVILSLRSGKTPPTPILCLVRVLNGHTQELSPVAPARAANGSAESESGCLDPRDPECT